MDSMKPVTSSYGLFSNDDLMINVSSLNHVQQALCEKAKEISLINDVGSENLLSKNIKIFNDLFLAACLIYGNNRVFHDDPDWVLYAKISRVQDLIGTNVFVSTPDEFVFDQILRPQKVLKPFFKGYVSDVVRQVFSLLNDIRFTTQHEPVSLAKNVLLILQGKSVNDNKLDPLLVKLLENCHFLIMFSKFFFTMREYQFPNPNSYLNLYAYLHAFGFNITTLVST